MGKDEGKRGIVGGWGEGGRGVVGGGERKGGDGCGREGVVGGWWVVGVVDCVVCMGFGLG